MTDTFKYSHSAWDTNFFEVTSGKIELTHTIAFEEVELFKNTLTKDNFTVIYNKDNNAYNNILIGQETESYLVDVNVQFQKLNNYFHNQKGQGFSISNSFKMNESILEIASKSFKYSRFYNDKKLNLDKAKNVYWNWVKSAFLKDNKFFITFAPNGKCLGFLLFSISDNHAIIELIAVDKSKVNKGIGSQLLNELEYFSKEKALTSIKVGTQIDNSEAIRFYTKNKYLYQSCTSVYHNWNN